MIAKIKNLRTRATIGVYDWERELKQDLLINITMDYRGEKASKTDNIDDTLNYLALAKEIIEKVEATQFELVEKLVDFVLEIVMGKELVEACTIEIDKPNAIFFAQSVSVIGSAKKERK